MKKYVVDEFIQAIEARPTMFVTSETASELDGVLRGYMYARSTFTNVDEEESELFRNFAIWLKTEKYQEISCLEVSWRSILVLYYSSEVMAFRKFFEYWREFRKACDD